MMVALLRLLDVTKVKDGGSLQKENRDHRRESRPPKRFVDKVEQLKPCARKKKAKKGQ